jgi:hypothetical protein
LSEMDPSMKTLSWVSGLEATIFIRISMILMRHKLNPKTIRHNFMLGAGWTWQNTLPWRSICVSWKMAPKLRILSNWTWIIEQALQGICTSGCDLVEQAPPTAAQAEELRRRTEAPPSIRRTGGLVTVSGVRRQDTCAGNVRAS